MEALTFVKEFIRSPRTVGATWPSSNALAHKMVDKIDFANAGCIVEYGPGTGVFTNLLVSKRSADTKLVLIERNPEFYRMLQTKYEHEVNVFIFHDSAENIRQLLQGLGISKVDYIVSGLPFAALPKATSQHILQETREILDSSGNFITFQYTLMKMQMFNSYFENIQLDRVLVNLPPAYVLRCDNNRL
jgi:phospholipid N-methyltransferase